MTKKVKLNDDLFFYMGKRASDISSEFQTKISNIFSSLDVNDGFIFLTGISNYITKILNELIGNSYVEIAKQLRDDEVRVEDVHKYVAKIIEVLQVDNRAPPDLDKTTQELFEIIDQIETQRIDQIRKSPLRENEINDYIDNLKDNVME